MAFRNKIKNNILENNEVYYYKEKYEEISVLNRQYEKEIEHLKKINSMLQAEFNQSVSDNQKLMEISSKLESIENATKQISDLQTKIDNIENSTKLINAIHGKLDKLSQTQKDNEDLLMEIKNTLVEKCELLLSKNELILSDNEEKSKSIEEDIKQVNIKFGESFDNFTSKNTKEFEKINSSLSDFNQENISYLSDEFSQMNNLMNSKHESFDSSLNNLLNESQSVPNEVLDLNESLNKINEHLDMYDGKLDIIENNSEEYVKNNENINVILDKITNIDTKIMSKSNIFRYNKLFKDVDEIRYSLVFNDTVKNSKWFKYNSLSLNNASSNYSFMYVLYRILNELRPSSILEFGMGQTTIMTSKYVNKFEKKLVIVEQDDEWMKNFIRKIHLTEYITLKQIETEDYDFKSTVTSRYKELDKELNNQKFDLIIIDGPTGYDRKTKKLYEYSRTNILDLFDNLNDEFMIIFDDYEREGEKNTAKLMCDLLDSKNIKYNLKIFNGNKTQLVINSPKYRSVLWY